MSYKNAMAGLPFGGGKAVIVADPERPKTPEEFQAFSHFVHSLDGRYVTAEDVGVNTTDMLAVRQSIPFVSELPAEEGSVGGDPSPWTAFGVFLSIQSAFEFKTGSKSLSGRTVAVQGVGNVGYHLCRHLSEAGASLVVADVNADNASRASREFGARVVSVEQILSTRCDVFSPYALGGVLNAITIPRLNASIVAGAANNQLDTPSDALRLQERKILFLPDYVINPGGIIAVAHEYFGGSSEVEVADDVKKIPARLEQIVRAAELQSKVPSEVADCLARSLIANPANKDAA